ncbi:YggT family protein [Tengunoibacter tsumagoiensis]|uniref:YggT family protein n=1 Tax=Tengunoibacter tsumagoiensis TaxID=2014871 RepID=A0A401ZWA7_9CHLR|nr:YggT family protein [Tengunoibacter tsumagoiensis]GCE11014.1 hypothetical protein KTT_08730 [Tengunoibacter tsumagoiensis]
MRTNPYPEEPARAQSMDAVLQRERMEDLPPRVVQQSVPAPQITENISDADSAENRQEEARTVRYAIGKLNDFLQWFVVVMEVTLTVRFLLMLIGADPSNLFAGFLYALTDIVLFPFKNIVASTPIHLPNQVFEWQTLIAMAIYWLVFWAIRRFLRILITTPEEPAN